MISVIFLAATADRDAGNAMLAARGAGADALSVPLDASEQHWIGHMPLSADQVEALSQPQPGDPLPITVVDTDAGVAPDANVSVALVFKSTQLYGAEHQAAVAAMLYLSATPLGN